MTPQVRKALKLFVDMVRRAYGDDFLGIVLFGSQARGDATDDSDVDVAVILRRIDDRRVVRDQLADLSSEVLMDAGEEIQAIAVSQDQWNDPHAFSNPSLVMEMKQDGVAMGGP